MAVYQERPYSEIAELLGIPVGTVKSRMHNSVKALRADVHQAVDEQTSEEMIAPLRLSLAQLNAPVAALANPSTPLPDELRGDAARLLKVVLRREMIDAEEEEVS